MPMSRRNVRFHSHRDRAALFDHHTLWPKRPLGDLELPSRGSRCSRPRCGKETNDPARLSVHSIPSPTALWLSRYRRLLIDGPCSRGIAMLSGPGVADGQ